MGFEELVCYFECKNILLIAAAIRRAAATADNDEDKIATCIIRGVNRPLLQKLKRLSFESPLLAEEL